MSEHQDEGPRFIWLDEDDVRCSPRHTTLKAALAFRENWRADGKGQRWVTDGGERKLVPLKNYPTPSDKAPAKLVIGEWVYREPTPEEQEKVDSVIGLIKEGYV